MNIPIWMKIFNFSINSAALMLIILCLLLTVSMRIMEKQMKRIFLILFSVMILYLSTNLLAQVFLLYPDAFVGSQACIFLESLFASMLPLILTVLLLHCSGEKPLKSPFFYIALFLFVVCVALLIVTQYTTFIYYLTPDNDYHRGPWYLLLTIPPGLILLLNLYILILKRNQLQRKQRIAFLFYLITPTIGMIVQILFYGVIFIAFSTAVAAMLMFLFILIDLSEWDLFQQKERARQQASIMVLQMRPHFISNTMTSIYYLCQQDPAKAQQVIMDFTTYLRKNFTAIAKEEVIPFSEELEHTRAYLSVEQVRYEDNLFVSFDTPHTDFYLPPLTLQPIVENALKHGMDPEREPLSITVRTRQTPSGSEITVEDNGPGFDRKTDDQPHIALANIRERLDFMCHATLEITPRPGGGTVVTIRIPKSS